MTGPKFRRWSRALGLVLQVGILLVVAVPRSALSQETNASHRSVFVNLEDDGILWIITADPVTGSIRTFRSSLPESEQSYPVSGDPIAVIAGDFNNDGKTDVIALSATPGIVTFLANSGDGKLRIAGETLVSPRSTILSRLDVPDESTIAVGGEGNLRILGIADGTAVNQQLIPLEGTVRGITPQPFGNVNADGFVVITDGPDRLLRFSRTEGKWKEVQRIDLGNRPIAVNPITTRNGHRLSLVTTRSLHLYEMALGFISGGMETQLVDELISARVVDVNSDGLSDIIAETREGNSLSFRQTSQGLFEQVSQSLADSQFQTPPFDGRNAPISNLGLSWPLPGIGGASIGNDYAEYNYVSTSRYHTGLDIAAERGTSVRSATSGRARTFPASADTINGDNHCMGNVVIIDQSSGLNPTGPFALYAHLDSITVANGASVTAGLTEVGKVGNTGPLRCSGSSGSPHLHFEVKDKSVLHNPIYNGSFTPSDQPLYSCGQPPCYWGYTPFDPDAGGYHDPVLNLHPLTELNPPLTISVSSNGVSIRIGPGSIGSSGNAGIYRVMSTANAGATFLALRSAPSTSTPGCSGWYQITKPDGSLFADVIGSGAALPEGWICKDLVATNPSPTLMVGLSIIPISGSAPLNTTVSASAGGTATGDINYTFWWHCADPTNSVSQAMTNCGSIPTPPNGTCSSNSVGYKCNGMTATSATVSHTYFNAGTYTAKVIAERGAATPAEDHKTVTVTATSISVTVTTNPAGRTFTVDGISYGTTQTFTWASGSSHTIATTSPQGSGTRYVFASWSDGGALSHTVTPTANTTYTANFTIQHLLTTFVFPPGGGTIIASPSSGDGYYTSGTSVQITASPSSGYVFSTFGGDLQGTTNPQPVSMNAPRTVTADFSTSNVSVTVNTSPAGRTFTVDGTLYTSSTTFSWTPGSSHTIGASSPQGSGTRYVFSNWSDGGAITHIVAPTSNTTYTASFSTQHLLTTSVSPGGAGTIIASPSSSDGHYTSGTTVQLTASPSSGYTFSSFSGDVQGTTNPQSVFMNAPRSVGANFNAVTSVSVTVTTSPAGRNFTVDGTSYSTTQTFTWVSGSSHTIATTSPQGSGTRYVFSSWSDGGAIAHTVATASNTTYTAHFTTQHLLTTSVSPGGAGTVTVSPASGDGYYTSGTPVQLTASPHGGYIFSGFTGALQGTSNPQIVSMSTPRSVTANFLSTSPQVALNPLSISFPAQVIGIRSIPTPLRLSNVGGSTLVLNGFQLTGSWFSADWASCPATLAPGSSCDIWVEFRPMGIGQGTGSLTIASNAPGSPHTMLLNGAGFDLTLSLTRPRRPSRVTNQGSVQTYSLSLDSPVAVRSIQLSCSVPSGYWCRVPTVAALRQGITTIDVSVLSRGPMRLRMPTTSGTVRIVMTIGAYTRSIEAPLAVQP